MQEKLAINNYYLVATGKTRRVFGPYSYWEAQKLTRSVRDVLICQAVCLENIWRDKQPGSPNNNIKL